MKYFLLFFLTIFINNSLFAYQNNAKQILPTKKRTIKKEDKLEENETSIEADLFEGGTNFLNGYGDVVLKKTDILLNTDEINTQKDIYSELELQSRLKKFPDDNSTKKEFLLININKNFKIRKEDDSFIYGKSLFYNEFHKTAILHNVQMFPGDKPSTVILAEEINKKDTIYKIKNFFVGMCALNDNNLLEEKEKDNFLEAEKIPEPNQNNILKSEFNSVVESNKYLPISLTGESIEFDSKENLATFNKAKIKLFNIPIMYIPTFSMHTNDDGDSGLLIPKFIFLGRAQTGIEIPLYIKVSNNFDFVISRNQYFTFPAPLGIDMKIAEGAALDSVRMRSSSTGITLRHLISNKYNFNSFYFFEGMITDKTNLIDNSTGLIQTNDGIKSVGVRGFFDLYAKTKLTNTTFLNIDYTYISDKNFLYIYRNDQTIYKMNSIHLFDVTENTYFSAELVQMQSMLLNFGNAAFPIVMPVLNGNIDFKKDKFGGNFYLNSQFSTINRTIGYDYTKFATDIGYTIPHITNSGYRVTFDAMSRIQYNNINYNGYQNSTAIAPMGMIGMNAYSIANNFTPGFGNYQYMAQNQAYNRGMTSSLNSFQFLNFTKLEVDKPLITSWVLGNTIIEPKLAIKYNPNQWVNPNMMINEDTFNTQLNHNNAFSLLQTNGLGVYDSGGSAVYGVNIEHFFKFSSIKLFGSLAQNLRFTGNNITSQILEQSGYYNSKSDIVGQIGIATNILQISTNYRYDTFHKEFRELTINSTLNLDFLLLSVGYSKFSQRATFFNRGMETINFMAKLKLLKKIEMNAMIMYNLSNEPLYGFSGGKTGIISMNYGIFYDISCVRVGIQISQNNFVLPGMPTMTTYSATVQLKDIG